MTQPANFDRLAEPYRFMEWATFGPWLGWCRCTFLGQCVAAHRALVLGDGDGRFTARLLASCPQVEVDAVDASLAMLEALMGRAGRNRSRVRTQRADLRTWQPRLAPGQAPFDLVFTHFLLDCLTTGEICSLATGVRAALSPSARWVVSEFAVPQGWFGRLVAGPVVWGLYRAFGLLTGLEIRWLPDYAGALRQAGFSLEIRRGWLGGLLVSEIWRP